MADGKNQLNPPQQVSYPSASYCAQAHQPQYNSQALDPPYPQQQCAGNVVLAVPQQITQVAMPPQRPKNYISMSLTTILCFFWPLGIAAMVFSCMVDSKYDAGKYEEAKKASRIALILNIIGILVGLPIYIISVIITIVVSIAASASASDTE